MKNKKEQENKKEETVKQTQPRLLKGVALNNAKDKTVKVLVNRYKFHSKYRKRYKASKKYLAHDEANKTQEGDKVLIQEIRPISKFKKWIVKENK